MDILFATSDISEINQYAELFAQINPTVRLLVPADIGLDQLNVIELGDHEMEKAKNQAQAYWNALPPTKKLPCFAFNIGQHLHGYCLYQQNKWMVYQVKKSSTPSMKKAITKALRLLLSSME